MVWEILVRVGMFSSGGENQLRSDFDHSSLFQSQKQYSVKIKTSIKSKLAWPVCTNSMTLK